MTPLEIPSPPFSGIPLGPITLHLYSLCILTGIVAGSALASRRWRERGGQPATLERILVPAIIAGIIGTRVYHVITDHQLYFGPGRDPWDALRIWKGGLGIWGGVLFGAVAAWLAGRRDGVRFWALADALAPGIALAQAIGRLGNWFNQELYGRPLQAWWALRIDTEHRVPGYEQFATYHPTFAYEMLWNLAGVAVLLWADRRFRLGHGKVFWGYVAFYTAGRAWIEHLRIDTVNRIGRFRLNEYTSWIMLALSLAILVFLTLRRPGREAVVQRVEAAPEAQTRQNGATVAARPEEKHDAGDDPHDPDGAHRG